MATYTAASVMGGEVAEAPGLQGALVPFKARGGGAPSTCSSLIHPQRFFLQPLIASMPATRAFLRPALLALVRRPGLR